MNNLGIKRLESNRLILRKFENNDYISMHNNYYSSEEVFKYLVLEKHNSIEDTKNFLENVILNDYKKNNSYRWAICLNEDNNVIGSIEFIKINKEYDIVELEFYLSSTYWNKKLMNESLNLIINYSFNELNLHSLIAKTNINNKACKKLLENNNFIIYKESYEIIKNKEVKLNHYKLINSNYKK